MGHARSDLPAISQKQRELRSSSLARHHHALPQSPKMTTSLCPNPSRGVRPPDCCASTQQSGAIPGASPHPGLRLDEADFGVVRSPSRERSHHPIFADQVRLPSTIVPLPTRFWPPIAARCPSNHCPTTPATMLARRRPVTLTRGASGLTHRPLAPRTLHFGDASVPRHFCPLNPSHATFGTASSWSLCHTFRNGRSSSVWPSSHV